MKIYFVQSTTGDTLDVETDRLRQVVISSCVEAGMEVGFIPDVAVAGKNFRREKAYLVSSSLHQLEVVRKAAPSGAHISHCVLICPAGLDGFSQELSSFYGRARKTLSESDLIITDSDLSRFAIESALDDRRLNIFVVDLHSGREVEPDGIDSLTSREGRLWQFEIAKSSSPLDTQWGGSTDWGFQPRQLIDHRPDTVPQGSLSSQSDGREVARIFEDTIRSDLHGKVAVMGHKLSFIDELSSAFGQRLGLDVTLDSWKYLSGPTDREFSQDLLRSSDIIIGEWARPNNIWIQNNAPDSSRLIVRAHRYEVTTDFPKHIDMARFEAAVVIVPWVGRTLVQKFGWPEEKMVFIPNYINQQYFSRRKLPGAEFTLGIVGITPDIKRVDLALDLLRMLRTLDPRFNLRVRSGNPMDHPHWKDNHIMRAQWGSVMTRLRHDPLLRDSVHFDVPGRDMGSWYQQIGIILSTSDLEGSHVALAEGIASGAVPVARRWPGIETLWPEEIIFDSMDDAVRHILSMTDSALREEVVSWTSTFNSIDPDLNLQAWGELFAGDMEAARSVFGPVDWHAPIFEAVDTSTK